MRWNASNKKFFQKELNEKIEILKHFQNQSKPTMAKIKRLKGEINL